MYLHRYFVEGKLGNGQNVRLTYARVPFNTIRYNFAVSILIWLHSVLGVGFFSSHAAIFRQLSVVSLGQIDLMAPLRARQSLSKERFPVYFGSVKNQAYQDLSPAARGASPRGYVSRLTFLTTPTLRIDMDPASALSLGTHKELLSRQVPQIRLSECVRRPRCYETASRKRSLD